ncbi:MAG: LytR C-terminal domain-containing protein [Patescibacteria group bacterium]|nr:LytR C-terminal domain-containing protein [Patescibacteria group bacterium]
MGRAWDILPPHKPTRNVKHGSTRKKTKNTSVFFVLIIVIFVGIFIYAASKNTPIDTNKTTTTTPSPLPDKKFSSSPKLEKNPEELMIKILNGTGRSEETAEVVTALKEIGFKVAKTENALSLYDQTTIYFESTQEKYAQEIAQNLTKYKVKTQQFSQESPYDLIIVIGAK